jgi:CubicO group peptidase (beta-lactamase class C family)
MPPARRHIRTGSRTLLLTRTMEHPMNPARSVFLALAAVAPLAGAGSAGAQAPEPARIDAVFAAWDRTGSPGCALGVVQDGRVVYQKGYGYANLDHGVPNAPHMVYYVGSVSKQFTAAAVALLAEEGRISLDDDVRRYIPELPDYGRPITIRHLVHHTSGLRDIYTLMELAGLRLADVMTDDDALGLIARQRELNFAPGDAYLYSNSGYWLLGQVVQRVTGHSLRVYAEDRIFRPLGMTDTRFHDQPDRILPNRVLSYGGPAGDVRITYLGNFDKIGAGGLYTTISDLARWDANFHEQRIGGPEFLRTLHTRGVLSGGDTIPYAFGNNVTRRRGLDIVRHSGSLMGFRADLVRYPAERFTVITMCNHGAIDAAALADEVAELFLGSRLAAMPPAQQAGGTGEAARTAAARRDAAGATTASVPAPLSAAQLAAFAGRYHSVELDATYVLDADAAGLRVTHRASAPRTLQPTGPDRFSAGSHSFTFHRDASGRVAAFSIDAGRVRNIRFERQP